MRHLERCLRRPQRGASPRKRGFHGLNVQCCHKQAARILRQARRRRLVVCHLGSGCSVSAVRDGRSVDATMGFTSLDGVPLATRPGSLDSGLLLHLLASGVACEELHEALNHRSGMLGICGLTGVREVEHAATAGDERAGERSALLRAAICERLGQLGVDLDAALNGRHARR
jgi:acetate kinase